MPRLETLSAELCDQFLTSTNENKLAEIGDTLATLMEFAAFEMARAGHEDLSRDVFSAAGCLKRSFETSAARELDSGERASGGIVLSFEKRRDGADAKGEKD